MDRKAVPLHSETGVVRKAVPLRSVFGSREILDLIPAPLHPSAHTLVEVVVSSSPVPNVGVPSGAVR